ncbi:MAG: DUF4439 domain-containing protein [Propioniciclava sp.]
MLGRRTLLAAMLGGATTLTASACARQPNGPSRMPTPLMSPSATPLPGQNALTTLVAGLDVARATAWPTAQTELIGWAGSVVRDQATEVSLPAPPPLPPASEASTSPDEAAVAGLTSALRDAGDAFTAQAADPSSARPLIWASMAAWAATTADQVDDPQAPREPARSVLTPAPQDAHSAVTTSLSTADQAVYGLGVIGGSPGLTEADRAALRRRITAWMSVRDALRDAAGPSPAPTPGAPCYDIARPVDREAARQAAAALEGAALPILGRSVAYCSADTAAVLANALSGAARSVARWGGLVERWPGLPQR